MFLFWSIWCKISLVLFLLHWTWQLHLDFSLVILWMATTQAFVHEKYVFHHWASSPVLKCILCFWEKSFIRLKKKKKRNSCLCNVELSMSWGCFLMTLYSYVLRICLLVLYIDSHGLQFSAVAVFLFSILAWCILMYKFNIVLVIIVCYICIYWQNDLLLSKLENSWEKGNDT